MDKNEWSELYASQENDLRSGIHQTNEGDNTKRARAVPILDEEGKVRLLVSTFKEIQIPKI